MRVYGRTMLCYHQPDEDGKVDSVKLLEFLKKSGLGKGMFKWVIYSEIVNNLPGS